MNSSKPNLLIPEAVKQPNDGIDSQKKILVATFEPEEEIIFISWEVKRMLR
jgi:hypothetical protein